MMQMRTKCIWILNNVEVQRPPSPADCIDQLSLRFDHLSF